MNNPPAAPPEPKPTTGMDEFQLLPRMGCGAYLAAGMILFAILAGLMIVPGLLTGVLP